MAKSLKGRKQSEMISERQQNIILTYKFLKEGKSVQWIEDFFLENQKLKPITVRTYLLESRKLISTESEMDVDFTSLLHDSRYEDIWEKEKDAYLQWSFVVEEPYQRANNLEIIRRYNTLLTAMKQRETMYGLRDKDLVLAMHSNISLTREYRSESFEQHLLKDFDLNKLSQSELKELIELLEESYEGDLFLKTDFIIDDEDEQKEIKPRAIQSPQKSKEVIKEAFNKIKDQPKEKRKTVEKKTSSIKVINTTPEQKGKTPEQVQENMKLSIIDSIKKKYKK